MNQLLRKGRSNKVVKSKSPVLQFTFDSLHRKKKDKYRCHEKRTKPHRQTLHAGTLNPKITMDQALLDKHFLRKHGPRAYYGQPALVRDGGCGAADLTLRQAVP